MTIPPSPDDTSQAIGALFAFVHQNRLPLSNKIKTFNNPYLGREESISKNNLRELIKNIYYKSSIFINKYYPKNIARNIFKGKINVVQIK